MNVRKNDKAKLLAYMKTYWKTPMRRVTNSRRHHKTPHNMFTRPCGCFLGTACPYTHAPHCLCHALHWPRCALLNSMTHFFEMRHCCYSAPASTNHIPRSCSDQFCLGLFFAIVNVGQHFKELEATLGIGEQS